MAKRGARQRHGFEFQGWVARKFFGQAYTGRWDVLPESKNPEGEEAGPISIKTSKWRSPVNLGDARRQFTTGRDFTLVVAFWQRKRTRKHIVRVVVAKVSAATWRTLWGQLTEQDIDSLDRLIKDRRVSYDEARKRAKEEKKRLSVKQSYMTLNPKIDSKTQRRLQCSLPFKIFFDQIVGERDPKPDETPMLWGEPVDVTLS